MSKLRTVLGGAVLAAGALALTATPAFACGDHMDGHGHHHHHHGDHGDDISDSGNTAVGSFNECHQVVIAEDDATAICINGVVAGDDDHDHDHGDLI